MTTSTGSPIWTEEELGILAANLEIVIDCSRSLIESEQRFINRPGPKGEWALANARVQVQEERVWLRWLEMQMAGLGT